MRTPLGEMGVKVGADGHLQAVVWAAVGEGAGGEGAGGEGPGGEGPGGGGGGGEGAGAAAGGRWDGALAAYFAKQPAAVAPLMAEAARHLAGTPFQRRVWAALVCIPWGETRTYGQLAAALGSSARAVGGAVGANPAPILVPCHRVMGADGVLTGFSAPGGVATKAWLLAHEGVLVG